MAIYHLSAKIHSRSTGASAVAAAAYRSGMELIDARTGEEHDYSRRSGIEGSEILAPEDSPDWVRDRNALWNAAEGAERRKDAQVAREVEVSAPVELSKEQRRELVQGFAEREFVARGMVADIAYHDGDGSNPHAHILLTTRGLEGEGFGDKERDWNRKELLSDWRETWAREANEALRRAGIGERIDHRSLIVQRDKALVRGEIWKAEKLDRDPEIHLGRAAWMAARQGVGNERTRRNDRIVRGNQDRERERSRGRDMIRDIQHQIHELQQAVRGVIKRVQDRGWGWSR